MTTVDSLKARKKDQIVIAHSTNLNGLPPPVRNRHKTTLHGIVSNFRNGLMAFRGLSIAVRGCAR